MRQKLLTKTYLRDVYSYDLKLFVDQQKDFYLVVKKFLKLKEPFVISSGITLIDENYYLVEITPKNENYNLRVYLDDKKQILQYYIDISLGNHFDDVLKVPYYDDLYLDITITYGKVAILDEDELEEALELKLISKKDFDLAIDVKNKLLKEIETGTNKYINMKLDEYLRM